MKRRRFPTNDPQLPVLKLKPTDTAGDFVDCADGCRWWLRSLANFDRHCDRCGTEVMQGYRTHAGRPAGFRCGACVVIEDAKTAAAVEETCE